MCDMNYSALRFSFNVSVFYLLDGWDYRENLESFQNDSLGLSSCNSCHVKNPLDGLLNFLLKKNPDMLPARAPTLGKSSNQSPRSFNFLA